MNKMQVEEISAFTYTFEGLLDHLATYCTVYTEFDPKNPPTTPPPFKKVVAVWDTGATNTVISRELARYLGLKPEGELAMHTVGGSLRGTPYYYVNIHLPGGILIPSLRVTEGVTQGCDVLIGMDIIKTGDLAVTHKDDNTTFTFQMPSTHHIDFQNGQQAVF